MSASESSSDEARKTNRAVVAATLKMHDRFHAMYEKGDIDLRFCNKMLRYFLLVDKQSEALSALLAENEAPQWLALRDWTDIDEAELAEAITREIEAERTTATVVALAAGDKP